MRKFEIKTSTAAETTDEQIKALAASFYPTIKAFYNTDEGRKMFEDYMNEVNGGEARKEVHSKSGGSRLLHILSGNRQAATDDFCIRGPAALIPIEERSMTIDDIKNAVKDVAVEFPISRTVLFGSRANGTSTP